MSTPLNPPVTNCSSLVKAHSWVPMKSCLGAFKKPNKKCKICFTRIFNSGNAFACKNCPFLIHFPCLVDSTSLPPCPDISIRELEKEKIISASLGVVLPGDAAKGSWGNNHTKQRYLIVTEGALFFAKDVTYPKPWYASLLSSFSSANKKKSKQLVLKKIHSQHTLTLTLSSEEERDKWFTILEEGVMKSKNVVSTPRNFNGYDRYVSMRPNTRFSHTLSIKVLSGKDLPAMDITGSSDTYCIMTCEHGYGKTSTIWNNCIDPFWGESFKFDLEDPKDSTLVVFVLDEDVGRVDDVMGLVEVPLKNLGNSPKAEWYPLNKYNGDIPVTGGILFSFYKTKEEISVTLVSAHNLASADPNGKSDPYVKLSIGKTKKKSKCIKKNLNPIFNESFVFPNPKDNDILEIRVFDWDIIGTDDFLGKVSVPLSSIESDTLTEKTFYLEPLTNMITECSKDRGSMRLELFLNSLAVQPLDAYRPFLDVLVMDGIMAVKKCGSSLVTNMGEFACNLLKIFDINLGAVQLCKDLTDYEIERTPNPDIIFRGNSVTTKVIDNYMKLNGEEFLVSILGPFFTDLIHTHGGDRSFEVDEGKLKKGESIEKNVQDLTTLCQKLLDRIFSSEKEMPSPIKMMLWHIQSKVKSSYSSESVTIVRYTSVTAFLFLRFFNPAVLNPKLFGIVEHMSSQLSRTCTLLAKIIQNLANLITSGEKKGFMSSFDSFVALNTPRMKCFVDDCCVQGEKEAAGGIRVPVTALKIWLEKELATSSNSLEKTRKDWFDASDPVLVQLASSLDNIKNYGVNQPKNEGKTWTSAK